MRVLILSADNFEDSELLVPYYRFIEEGIQVDIASTRTGRITGKHGYQVEVDKTLEEVNPTTTSYSSSPEVRHRRSCGNNRPPWKLHGASLPKTNRSRLSATARRY